MQRNSGNIKEIREAVLKVLKGVLPPGEEASEKLIDETINRVMVELNKGKSFPEILNSIAKQHDPERDKKKQELLKIRAQIRNIKDTDKKEAVKLQKEARRLMNDLK